MPLSLDLLSLVHAGAARTVPGRARQVAAAGYYFGYWFSHRRA